MPTKQNYLKNRLQMIHNKTHVYENKLENNIKKIIVICLSPAGVVI